MNSPEVAVFNLERTLAREISGNAFLDAAEAGLVVPRLSMIAHLNRKQQCGELYNWFTNKNEEELTPWLETVAEKTAERIAPWAKLVMAAEVQLGREICLYSSTTPDPLLDAYANGIEKSQPKISIEHLFGKLMELNRYGKFTGTAKQMLKAEEMESLQKDGYNIALVADSFNTAIPAIKKGKKRLLVNPDVDLRKDYGTERYTRIYWDSAESAITRVEYPFKTNAHSYNLKKTDERKQLLEGLGYSEVVDDLDLEI